MFLFLRYFLKDGKIISKAATAMITPRSATMYGVVKSGGGAIESVTGREMDSSVSMDSIPFHHILVFV